MTAPGPTGPRASAACPTLEHVSRAGSDSTRAGRGNTEDRGSMPSMTDTGALRIAAIVPCHNEEITVEKVVTDLSP